MRITTSKHAKKNTSGKVLATVALVAAAAGVAGLGTYGSFTSTTSASATVTAGTVKVELGANGANNRLSVAATGLVPGDTIQRAVTLSNTGNQDLGGLTLTTAASTSSKLDTDATNGLQLSIESCATGWVEAGTSSAYTYTCTSPSKTVLSSRPVVGANLTLSNLTATANGKTDNLRVTLSFPKDADNSFQGQSSVIGLDFTGTQRAATNR